MTVSCSVKSRQFWLIYILNTSFYIPQSGLKCSFKMVLKGVARCGRTFLMTANGVSLVVSMLSIIVGLVIKFGGNILGDVMDVLHESLATTMNKSGMEGVDVSKFDLTVVVDVAGIGLVVIGAVLFFVSGLGFFGSKTENQTALIIYSMAVGVIIVGELSFLIVIFSLRNKFDGSIKTPLKKLITEKYAGFNGSDVVSLSFNFFMIQMSCCGVDGFGDFYKAKRWSRYIPIDLNKSWPLLMPIACCKQEFRNKNNHACAMNPTSMNSNYMTGCYDSLWEEIHEHNSATIATSVTTGLFQVLLIVMACRVSHAIGVHNQRIKDATSEAHTETSVVQTISNPSRPKDSNTSKSWINPTATCSNNGNILEGLSPFPATLTALAIPPINSLNSLNTHPGCTNVMNSCCQNSFNLPTCSNFRTSMHCQNPTYRQSLFTSQTNPLNIHSYCHGLQREHFAGMNGAQPVPIYSPKRLSECNCSSDLPPYMFGNANAKVLPRYESSYDTAPPPYPALQREIVILPEQLNDQRKRSTESIAKLTQVLDRRQSIATRSHVQNSECCYRNDGHPVTNDTAREEIEKKAQSDTREQRPTSASNNSLKDFESFHQASDDGIKTCSFQQHIIEKDTTARNATKTPNRLTDLNSNRFIANTGKEISHSQAQNNDNLCYERTSKSLCGDSDISVDKMDDVLNWMKGIPKQTDGTDPLYHHDNSDDDDPTPKNKTQPEKTLTGKNILERIDRKFSSHSGRQHPFRQSRRGLFNRRSLNSPLNETMHAVVDTGTRHRSVSIEGD